MSAGNFDEALGSLAEVDTYDNPVKPELSAAEHAIAKAINSGGSGRGMSYYAAASRCGRKVRLSEERHARVIEAGHEGLPSAKSALVIGSIYHLLHQQMREPRPDVELDFMDGIFNVNVIEAMRMFRGWCNIWGGNYWGKPIAVEKRLSTADLSTHVFEGEVTGTMDMVVEMSEDDAAAVQRRLPGIEPGRYIVDWKTADGNSDGVALALGLQSLWYPALWNMTHPDAPVRGTIFDIAMKRGKRKDRAMYVSDFQAVYAPAAQDCIDHAVFALRGMVRQGRLNVLTDTPNRAECVDWMGKTCPFFNGDCDGETK